MADGLLEGARSPAEDLGDEVLFLLTAKSMKVPGRAEEVGAFASPSFFAEPPLSLPSPRANML